MRGILVLAAAVLLAACTLATASSVAGPGDHSGAVSLAVEASGKLLPPPPARLPNLPELTAKEKKKLQQKPDQYIAGTDFVGVFHGIPVNPTLHLQRVLVDDKKFVASIMRAPMDLGDPLDCKHTDLEKDTRDLRKLAVRINHRRISLRQQQHWIDRATDGLRKIEAEIKATTETALNMAEQLDNLEMQRQDISNHVRRAMLIKELDNTSTNLMRLKDSRIKSEVAAQEKHNNLAMRNDEHNKVLARLHIMRTTHGLALGRLEDPKPYRFAQQGMEEAGQAEQTPTEQAQAEQTQAE